MILYYPDDVDVVAGMVDREFRVDTERSVDKRSALRPDQFGYLSGHKIVRISDSRKSLLEWSGLGELVAEVQIRSVLQHSWAAIQHTLEYKSAADAPREFRRRLVRLAGLLELADEEFVSLKHEQVRLVDQIASRVEKGELDITIDIVSLGEYLPRSSAVSRIVGAAVGAGITIDKQEPHGASQLVQACRLCAVTTTEELEARLGTIVESYLLEFFAQFFEDSGSAQMIGDSGHFVAVALLAFFGREKAPSEIAEAVGWDEFFAEALVEGAQRLVEKYGAGDLLAKERTRRSFEA